MNKILDKPFWIKVVKECEELNSVQVGKNYKVVETNAENYITEEGISIRNTLCKKVIPLFNDYNISEFVNSRVYKTNEENTAHLKEYIHCYREYYDKWSQDILDYILENPEMFIIANDDAFSNIRICVNIYGMYFNIVNPLRKALNIPDVITVNDIKELAEKYIIDGILICLKEPVININKKWFESLNIPASNINRLTVNTCIVKQSSYNEYVHIPVSAYKELKKFE